MLRSELFKSAVAFLIAAMLLLPATGKAQTWSEWFHQNKTQIKYLNQQIAYLQLYLGYIKQGFKIAHEGLEMAHQIKNGEFLLHNAYISSLKAVNPEILKGARIAQMIASQGHILSSYRKLYTSIRNSGQFRPDEISFFSRTFNHLVEEINGTLDQLVQVTTSGKLEMTDDARITRIDELYKEAQGQRTAFDQMERDIQVIAGDRLKEQAELSAARKIVAP